MTNFPYTMVLLALFLAACSPLTEREQAEKLAKKQGDDRQLMLIEEVHKILDAPAPTQDQIDTLVKNALSNMVRIEGGEFIMGVSPERMGGDWDGWKPVDGRRQSASIHESAFFEHPVRLSTYYISKFETTYAEFDAFKKATGRDIRFSEMDGWYKGYAGGFHDCCRAPNKPAAADWYEAKDYCEWLGEQSGLLITLPTEAQWEYAARERGKWLMFATKWGGLDGDTNGKNDSTREVDALSHSMNDLNLYFMSGNLSEWVLDWYDPDYYQKSPLQDPVNEVPVQAYIKHGVYEQAKVHRGGHQFLDNSLGDPLNVFNRFYRVPDHYSFGSVGIRCVVNTEKAL